MKPNPLCNDASYGSYMFIEYECERDGFLGDQGMYSSNIHLSNSGLNLTAPVLIVSDEHDFRTSLEDAQKLLDAFKNNKSIGNTIFVTRKNSILHGNVYNGEITSADVGTIVTSFLMGEPLDVKGDCRQASATEISCDDEETSKQHIKELINQINNI